MMRRQALDRARYYWGQWDGFLQLGLLLAIVNLAVQVFVLPPQMAEAQRVERELAALQGQRALPFRQETAALPAHFPDSSAIIPVVQQIEGFARRHDLLLLRSSSQFAPQGQAGAALRVLQVELDLNGSYASSRAFVDELLRHLPYVAIRDLNWTRQDAGAPDLMLHCSLRVYLSS